MRVAVGRLHGSSRLCRWFRYQSCRDGRLGLSVVRCPCRPDEWHAAASFTPNGGRGDTMADTERPDDLQAERYSLIATGTGAGVWDIHFLRRRGYLSPRWKEIVGYTGDDAFAGQAVLEERLHPEDRERYAATRRDHLERRRPFSLEVRIDDGQGGYRWIHVIAQAQWDRDGRPVRLVGSLCDVTARKLAELTIGERQRAQGRLEGVTLTAREIANHLNNELAVESWALELVQQVDDLPGELRPWLDSATRSEERRVGKECRSRLSPYH